VTERFEWATLLEVDLKTGRTHQIRVHCAAIGHPIIGDTVYGRQRIHLPGNSPIELQNLLRSVRRHLLHAARLTLFHPITGQSLTFEAALPADMQGFIDRARELTFPD
jgi:23S rRNA pseudouridine1911/1915/1917 synthase